MGTIVTICLIVAAFYYFKKKKSASAASSEPIAPSDRPATIRFTDDSDDEFNARKEWFASVLQSNPKLQESYSKILGAFIPNNKGEFAGFIGPTEYDRAKFIKKSAFLAMEEFGYSENEYVTWCKALYDDILIRMNAKKRMKQSVAIVFDDVEAGDSLIESVCGIEKLMENSADGNKIEITTGAGEYYKFKFKKRDGEVFCLVPSGVYQIFKEGVSFDFFQRCPEVLIAICGLYEEPNYTMTFHHDLPSYDTFYNRQNSNK